MSLPIKQVFCLLEPLHQPTMLEQLKEYTPFQLLIATLLSARTRDSTVIPLVKTLFQKYPTPVQLANAKIADLEKEMHGVGFYRVKSKHVKELSKIVVEKYHGKIPQTIE